MIYIHFGYIPLLSLFNGAVASDEVICYQKTNYESVKNCELFMDVPESGQCLVKACTS